MIGRTTAENPARMKKVCKDDSRLLQAETDIMADRLSQVRLQMQAEKDARSKHKDGSIWSSGRISKSMFKDTYLEKKLKSKSKLKTKPHSVLMKTQPPASPLPDRNSGTTDMFRNTNSSTLADGYFDEAASSASFADARHEWLNSGTTDDMFRNTNSSTLADGYFDEAASSASFADARHEWLNSGKSIPPSKYPTETSSPKPSISYSLANGHFNESSELSIPKNNSWAQEEQSEMWRSPNDWNVVKSQNHDDTLPDYLHASDDEESSDEEDAEYIPPPSILAKPATSTKSSCFQCYKLFFSTYAVLSPFVGRDKLFCSSNCVNNYLDSTRIKCASSSCRNRFLLKNAYCVDSSAFCSEKCSIME